MFEPLEGYEAEVAPLLIRQLYHELAGGVIVRAIGAVPGFGLDRWALVGDWMAPAHPTEQLDEEYGDAERHLAVHFIAAFGLPWAMLDHRVLDGQRRLWDTEEVRAWLQRDETTGLGLLELRRYTGDRPSQAGRAIVLMEDYARNVW